LLTACATTGDVENIQNQITEVSTKTKEISATVNEANAISAEAASKANKAEQSNLLAAELSKSASGKLNRLFNIIMKK